jgi:hypothetical protein
MLVALKLDFSARILAESFVGFGYYFSSQALYLRFADFLIIVWLILSLLVLSLVHFQAFHRDENIRDSTWEILTNGNLKEREQRKRVSAIIAGMLVAREINATELLSSLNGENSQRVIDTAMTRAETILARMADSR